MTEQMSFTLDTDSNPTLRTIREDELSSKVSALHSDSVGYISNRFVTFNNCEHSDGSKQSFSIIAGHRVFHGVPITSDYMKWSVVPGFQFELVTVEGYAQVFLVFSGKNRKYHLLEKFNREELVGLMKHVDSSGLTRRNQVFRFCITDAFKTIEFSDVLEHSTTPQIHVGRFSKRVPFRLTESLIALVEKAAVDSSYFLELQECGDVFRLVVKYERLGGGFTVCFIDPKSKPGNFDISIEE